MSINVNGMTISGGTTLTATDSSNNKVYQQDAAGRVMMPTTAGGSALTPLFKVGWSSGSWTDFNGYITFAYTAGNGYYNIGNHYSTSTGRFTAPLTGLYMFQQMIYMYYNLTSYTNYAHPLFVVNGSGAGRRPGGAPYRMRLYGLPSSYGHDSDCNELIYLYAGDWVQIYLPVNGGMQGLASSCSWSGAYLGA